MTFHYLHLQDWSIFEQLKLEEALLRTDDRNIFIISEGSKRPSIVMGISGKIEQHVDPEISKTHAIPVIRRFSGGGTVIVDEHTLFVTFIANRSLLEPAHATPESIMRWAETIFFPAFGHPEFHLRDNDFVIEKRKCGGNAQYLQKHRWLLHTSFLWNYLPDRLNLLKYPPKTPTYRQNRNHEDFVCRLCDYIPSQPVLIEQLRHEMSKKFLLQPLNLALAQENLSGSLHRQATRLELL
ncbi:MAG: lipoate--protein ligase family protein [Simkania sp.]|nr:lipoate--protein ligase family protein [Simkania sp.]